MEKKERRCDSCIHSEWSQESSFDHYRIESLLICKKHSTLYADKIVREWECCEEYEPREHKN